MIRWVGLGLVGAQCKGKHVQHDQRPHEYLLKIRKY